MAKEHIKTETPAPAPVAAAPKAPVLNPIRLLYDTWDNEGVRHMAGTVVNLPLGAAKQIVAEGKGERADPFPGEL